MKHPRTAEEVERNLEKARKLLEESKVNIRKAKREVALQTFLLVVQIALIAVAAWLKPR